MGNFWSMSRYMIPVMVVSIRGSTLFAEGAKHVHFWAVTIMFQGDTWIFAAVVGIDLTNDMKRDLITENYSVQKSLVFYPLKHLHNHNYPR
jgi:hypothetical protein